MRIVHIVSRFYPYIGGVENYVYNLATKLVEQGHENFIVTCKFHKLQKLPTREYLNGIEIIRTLPWGWIRGMPIMFSSPSRLNELKPDIVHVHGSSINGNLAALTAYYLKIPLILTYYADLGTKPKMRLTKAHFLIEKYINFHIAKKIIVISEIYRNKLKSRGISDQKLELIQPGVSGRFFRLVNNKDTIKKKLNLAEVKTILFVGALDSAHAYKRLDLLIESILYLKKKTSNFKLVVIGDGPLRQHIQKKCAKLGVGRDVIFEGTVSDDILCEYYVAADVFVLPSPYPIEGFGIVVLEAMASGCPVIVTSACGAANIVKEAKSGLVVEPFDIKGLASSIYKIISNENIAKIYGLNGRKFAKLYSWKKVAEKTENIYITASNSSSI